LPVRLGGDKWVIRVRAVDPEPRLRLICFPYAGGSPEAFRSWAGALPPHVELIAVRLPGRGVRLRERMYRSWDPLVEDAYAALAGYLDEPHAFYGHSFGGRLAYELTHVTVAANPGLTHRLFVSGCRSPDAAQPRPYLHELPDDEFRAALRAMGGTPGEVLDHPALMRMALPAIHGDIRLAELWNDRHGEGVDVPITVLYGRDDPIDGEPGVRGWARFTTRGAQLVEFPAGHFFVDTRREEVLRAIRSRLDVAGQ
jgi:medium-chain acyl-[acyl-carrier-protein] hydrolase